MGATLPIPHDREQYCWRNLLGRKCSAFKTWRPIATRDDKTREACLGSVARASIKLWVGFVRDALRNLPARMAEFVDRVYE